MFAAWLNHDDSRAINSLDMLAGENGSRHVKHYLIDFGSTLGSGSTGPQKPRAGWEYLWEPKAVLGRIATLGLWVLNAYESPATATRVKSKKIKP